ncbi:MAG: HlyD family efflux transporter periplasmic adaptor subunit [Planctomycetota bacterium]
MSLVDPIVDDSDSDQPESADTRGGSSFASTHAVVPKKSTNESEKSTNVPAKRTDEPVKSTKPDAIILHATGDDDSDPLSSNGTVQPEMSSSSPHWWMLNVIVPLILLLGVGGLVRLLGTIEPPTRPDPDGSLAGRLRALPAVEVVTIESLASSGRDLHLNADGLVVPFREVMMATEVAGNVVKKSPRCEAGQFVRRGTVLIEIDPTDYELEVQRLTRLREQEYEALGEVDQEMINAKRSLEIADADIELQRREVARLQKLPKNFASQGDIDKARRTLLQAEQQMVNYQNQIDLLKSRRTRLEAAERLAATQLKAAEVNLERTKIRAPIDGVIVQENAELNTFVDRGNPVVTMEDTSSVEVSANLRSDQLFWIVSQRQTANNNQPAGLANELASSVPATGDIRTAGYTLPQTPVRIRYQVTGREDTSYVWSGKLLGYDGIGMDEQTRTVPVRVLVDDPRSFEVERNGELISSDGRLRPAGPTALVRGMFVNLQFILDPVVPLFLVPAEALRPGNRVWEFEPDDTVLELNDPAAVNEVTATTKASSNTNETKPEDTIVEQFDVAQWDAGRLDIHNNIRPVDSVTDPQTGQQHWICEAPEGALENGSQLIVSPLGSINQSGVPVRARGKADANTNAAQPTESQTRIPTQA